MKLRNQSCQLILGHYIVFELRRKIPTLGISFRLLGIFVRNACNFRPKISGQIGTPYELILSL